VLSSDVVIALPGGRGTSSEVELAQRYGRPLAAFVAQSTDIPDLPTGVPMLATLAQVQEFIRDALKSA
jgi:SLOG cluster4 family